MLAITRFSSGVRLCAVSVFWALCFVAAAPGNGGSTTQPSTRPVLCLKPPAVGDKAPDFTLDTLDEKKLHLAEMTKNGPVVVIELRGWVGYQCPICNQQVNELITHSKDILAAGAKLVFVYPGPADKLKDHAQEFISGKGLPDGYSFVTDPDMKFVNAWGLRWNKVGETAYPSTFVVDKEGVVRFAKVSDTHGGRATAEEIVKAIGQLK